MTGGVLRLLERWPPRAASNLPAATVVYGNGGSAMTGGAGRGSAGDGVMSVEDLAALLATFYGWS